MRCGDSYDGVNEGYEFRIRNEDEQNIMNFVVAYDLMLTNTCFEKRESHLITFKIGRTQAR